MDGELILDNVDPVRHMWRKWYENVWLDQIDMCVAGKHTAFFTIIRQRSFAIIILVWYCVYLQLLQVEILFFGEEQGNKRHQRSVIWVLWVETVDKER